MQRLRRAGAAAARTLRYPIRALKAVLRHYAEYPLTFLWRTVMFRTTVIAITGSTGKTTAKECLATMLSPHGKTLATLQNQNDQQGVPRTIRRMRPWHRFAVVEVGTGSPGDIRRSARLLRPHVAVVLCVARTHTNAFRTLENTAREKATLLEVLGRRGIAILNADDPRVAAMGNGLPCRVRRFGRADDCDFQALAVSSRWPQRLRFRLRTSATELAVHTQLVGEHWLGSVLGAIAAATACGVPAESAARSVAAVAPYMGRMQPVAIPSGAVVIRDEENGSVDTLAAMIAVLEQSRASRRGLIFGDVSDLRQKPRRRLRAVGEVAARHCDFAAFVGSHAHHAVKAAIAAGMDPAACRDFASLEDTARWLAEVSRDGDLVFIKGRTTEHLTRVVMAQFGAIGCWKHRCTLRRVCDVCELLQPDFDLDHALRPVPAATLSGPAGSRIAAVPVS